MKIGFAEFNIDTQMTVRFSKMSTISLPVAILVILCGGAHSLHDPGVPNVETDSSGKAYVLTSSGERWVRSSLFHSDLVSISNT